MSVYDYSAAIKLTFDRPIASVIDTPAGIELIKNHIGTYTESGHYGSNVKELAFDGNVGSYWYILTVGTQWLGITYSVPKRLGKVRSYSGGSHRPRAYELVGSDDNTNWTVVASGEFPNATGWNDITFTPVAYRYWRLNITTRWSTYLRIYEMEFLEAVDKYDVAGWSVTGFERTWIPSGSLVPKTYQVYKATKADDDYAVILWLKRSDRMRLPEGLVTVQYTRSLGNLAGAANAYVEDFTITFSPTGITPIFNPNGEEHINMTVTLTPSLIGIFYVNGYGDEHINMTVTITAQSIHVDDLEQ